MLINERVFEAENRVAQASINVKGENNEESDTDKGDVEFNAVGSEAESVKNRMSNNASIEKIKKSTIIRLHR